MNSIKAERHLELIIRLTYTLPGLQSRLKVEISQFLHHNFNQFLSVRKIQDIENRKAVSSFNPRELDPYLEHLSVQEWQWTAAFLEYLSEKTQVQHDFMLQTELQNRIRILKSLNPEISSAEEWHTVKHQIQTDWETQREMPILLIKGKTNLLNFEYLLRWVILFAVAGTTYSNYHVNGISVLAYIFLLVNFFRTRIIRRKNADLLAKYQLLQHVRLEYTYTSLQYTLLVLFILTGVYIGYLISLEVFLLSLFALPLYYFIQLRFLPYGEINESDLIQITSLQSKTHLIPDVDENDELIAAQETRLTALLGKLDAYILESALFGALSFSGFLQIMATDLLTFKDLESFATNLLTISKGFINLDWAVVNSTAVALTDKVNLFSLLSLQSLICSVFFLAVIAARLKFSSITDKVRTALTYAKVYNEKEEYIHEIHLSQPTEASATRINILNKQVYKALESTTELMAEVDPIMKYMQYFRNAGVLLFFAILVTSSLFFSSIFSISFLFLLVGSLIYFNRIEFNLGIKSLLLEFRIKFHQYGNYIALSIAVLILAGVVGPFIQGNSVFFSLLVIGIILLILYLPLWLLLNAHYDENFERGAQDQKVIRRWNMIRIILAAEILLCGTGMLFKLLHLSGAHILLLIGIQLLCFTMYFVGYHLSKRKWLGILIGITLAILYIGILFKTLHYDGASDMLKIGLSGQVILIPILLLMRKDFHRLLIRFVVISMLVALYMLVSLFV